MQSGKNEHQIFDQAAALIRRGKNDEAKSILENNTNLPQNTSGPEKLTLLHIAAEAGNNDMIQHLIDLGSDVDAKTTRGSTPVMLAMEKKYEPAVETLLYEGNCHVHARDLFKVYKETKLERRDMGLLYMIFTKGAMEFVESNPDYMVQRIKDLTEL